MNTLLLKYIAKWYKVLFIFLFIQGNISAQTIKDSIKINRFCDNVIVLNVEPVQQNNTIAIATNKGIVVIDNNISQSYALLIRNAIIKEFNRDDFAYVINTHCDWDHVGGNQVFKDIPIVAHKNCLDTLKKYKEEGKEKLQADSAWAASSISYYKDILKEMPENSRNYHKYKNAIQRFEIFINDLNSNFEFVPPTIAFTDYLFLDMDNINIFLYYMGNAHRNSDIIIYIPEANLLIIGDLQFDMNISHLRSTGAGFDQKLDIKRWIEILSIILNSNNDIKYIIPGHYNIHNKEWLVRQFDYLKTIWNDIQQAKQNNIPFNEFLEKMCDWNKFSFDESWKLDFEFKLEISELQKRHVELIKLIWEQN